MGYYDCVAPTCTVDVLGTEYGIYLGVEAKNDELLLDCTGYCDKTTKRIVVGDFDGCNLGDEADLKRYCLRHEIVHAFLFESGIAGDTIWDIEGQEHPEHMVEWIAMQFPKLIKAFQAVGAI